MKTSLLWTVIGVILLCSWGLQETHEIKKAAWLIGSWENKAPRGSIYETWIKVSDTEFSGKSYILNEKDTVVFEDIRILQEGQKLFYIPTVKHQNDGLPVRFVLKAISDTAMVFENLQHDFPQVISYTKTGANALIAEISGMKNGQERKQTFPMKRIK